MDSEAALIIALLIGIGLVIGMIVGTNMPRSEGMDYVKVASNSADIRRECDKKYDMTVFKEVPIKCLKEYKVLQ